MEEKAWQTYGNVIGLAEAKKIQNELFTAKERERRQNWMASINTGHVQWQNA